MAYENASEAFFLCVYINENKCLFDVQYKSLEVFSFRMIYIDRMVGRLGKLVHDAYAATALGCCREYGIAKILLAYHLRA